MAIKGFDQFSHHHISLVTEAIKHEDNHTNKKSVQKQQTWDTSTETENSGDVEV